MRRLIFSLIAVTLLAPACAGGAATENVLVDYKHDEFASAFFNFYPNRVEAHPGDTVVFRQAWSGEPHSVTMGTIVDQYGQLVKPYLKIFAKKGFEGLPDETPPKIDKIEKKLPWMVEDNGKAAQNGAQPCFLRKGFPPKKPKQHCAKAQQRQPEFTGRYSYFNSGFIPYAGPNGDTYTLKIADTAKPGEHFFYCNYHGPFMSGFLTIKPRSAPIPSQEAIATEANKEIDIVAGKLLNTFRDATRGVFQPPKDAVPDLKKLGLTRTRGGKTYFKGWLAGMFAEHVDTAEINEFVPSRLHVKVGQKMTWVILGGHTISFNVPKYFPVIQVLKDGTVRRNPRLDKPAGGAPKPPEEDFDSSGPTKPNVIDAGSWNGRGFWSTGTIFAYDNFTAYSLRITRPGTYKFACLVHPPMVGTLTVTR